MVNAYQQQGRLIEYVDHALPYESDVQYNLTEQSRNHKRRS